MKVVKFGGSSLGDVSCILAAKNIVLSDLARTFVVVSAPGKCAEFGRKITDLLIAAHAELNFSSSSDSLQMVSDRFRKLSQELEIDISAEIERTNDEILINRENYDFVISRGEYLMALLFAKLVGYRFIDAAFYIVIRKNGKVNEAATRAKMQKCIAKNEKIVMGGFYGQGEDGGVKTFTRGGSDYSGAIAAVCLGATLYENFTDTYGVQTANPTIVANTKTVTRLDYKTMYKLSLAGASVIYPKCLPLLRRHCMPLKVDCTFDPSTNFTRVDCLLSRQKYFCITYNTKQNINKNTAEVICAFNKINLTFSDLKTALRDVEVYLVKLERNSFTLLTPVDNLATVVNLLHEHLLLK